MGCQMSSISGLRGRNLNMMLLLMLVERIQRIKEVKRPALAWMFDKWIEKLKPDGVHE